MDIKQELKKLFDKNEIHRLKKALKDKNDLEVIKWGQNYDNYIHEKYHEAYEKVFIEWMKKAAEDIDVSIVYALHFNESTRFGQKRLNSFMDDLRESVKGIYTSEFNTEEYRKMLENDGIKIE